MIVAPAAHRQRHRGRARAVRGPGARAAPAAVPDPRAPRDGAGMKPAAFEYHAPRTVEEVVALLAEHGDEAKVLAGGQSLVPLLVDAPGPARRSSSTSTTSTSLAGISATGDGLAIGAIDPRARGRAVAAGRRAGAGPGRGAPDDRSRHDPQPGHGRRQHRPRRRRRPSCPRSPWSPRPSSCCGAPRGERVVRRRRLLRRALHDHHGRRRAARRGPACRSAPAGAGWAFQEIARRHGDFALVGVAAMVALDQDAAHRRGARVPDRRRRPRRCGRRRRRRASSVRRRRSTRSPPPPPTRSGTSTPGVRHARIGGVPPPPRRRRRSPRADHRRRATGRRSIVSDEIEIVVNGERRRARRRSAR